jgi:hypothetical protein
MSIKSLKEMCMDVISRNYNTPCLWEKTIKERLVEDLFNEFVGYYQQYQQLHAKIVFYAGPKYTIEDLNLQVAKVADLTLLIALRCQKGPDQLSLYYRGRVLNDADSTLVENQFKNGSRVDVIFDVRAD